MELLCPCGHVIRDQTHMVYDQPHTLPYKAHFIPDEDKSNDMKKAAEKLEAFLMAREAGDQEGFLLSYFGERYPTDLDTKEILFDLLTMVNHSSRFLYECENCGRVFIEKDPGYGKKGYGTYLPEGNTRTVLRSLRSPKDK